VFVVYHASFVNDDTFVGTVGILLTTLSILSYTAFLLGAVAVTQFQLLAYAVSLTCEGYVIVFSVIAVTCPKEFVVICGTFVALHLAEYAVCVVNASCLPLHVFLNPVVSTKSLISKSLAE
jgi:hypothetical protein